MPRMNTPSERLCRALTLRGYECQPAAIVQVLARHGVRVSRQLARKWLHSGAKYMRPMHLWALSDALDVSARWLAAIDESAMMKPLNLTRREERAVLIVRAMKPNDADAWIKAGESAHRGRKPRQK